MKLNTKSRLKNRTFATCLSTLVALSSNVTRLRAYNTDNLPENLNTMLKAFGKEDQRNGKKLEDLIMKISTYNVMKTKNEQNTETKQAELLSSIITEVNALFENLCSELPSELHSTIINYANAYLQANDKETRDLAFRKLSRLLKTQKLPNEILESLGYWFKKDFTRIVNELAPPITLMATSVGLLASLSQLQITGNALDDLKAAAKSNSKKYPTLTWVQLKSKVPAIKKRLIESLAGQEEAIDNIIIQLNNHCTYLELCEQLNEKPKRSLVMHFYGAPGVGKSSALRIIAEELGIGVLSFGMSSAVEDNGKHANTVLARLMNPDVIDTRVTKAYFKTPLRKAVENPGTMIIGFDEIEKMRKLDAQISKCDYRNDEGFISPSSLDEAMRDVKDQGKFAGFDVSDKIFVTISNETADSLNELEPSFKDRLLGNLIYFKKFDVEAYKELIIKSSRLLFDAYREENIELSWSESALEHYANIFYKEGYSGRRIVEFIDRVSGKVQDYRSILKDSRNWIINYNSTLDGIVIEDNLLSDSTGELQVSVAG